MPSASKKTKVTSTNIYRALNICKNQLFRVTCVPGVADVFWLINCFAQLGRFVVLSLLLFSIVGFVSLLVVVLLLWNTTL